VRIAVLIPSRGRPLLLLETLLRMRGMESGAHDVQYVIGCDADDDQTVEMAMALLKGGFPVVPRIGKRQASLGGLVNLMAEKCPADVYCSLGDDVRVMTQGWDEVIGAAWRKEPDGLWWWCCSNDATFAIVSEGWRAAAGRIFTDYFPFWYDDLWLIEVQRYVLGRKGDRLDCWIADRAPGTHRMRDLAHWDAFFWSRREERKEQARMICERLGKPFVDPGDLLDLKPNAAFDDAAKAAIQDKQGAKGPPTPEYLAAFLRSNTMMETV
jgi:hypothetical protein